MASCKGSTYCWVTPRHYVNSSGWPNHQSPSFQHHCNNNQISTSASEGTHSEQDSCVYSLSPWPVVFKNKVGNQQQQSLGVWAPMPHLGLAPSNTQRRPSTTSFHWPPGPFEGPVKCQDQQASQMLATYMDFLEWFLWSPLTQGRLVSGKSFRGCWVIRLGSNPGEVRLGVKEKRHHNVLARGRHVLQCCWKSGLRQPWPQPFPLPLNDWQVTLVQHVDLLKKRFHNFHLIFQGIHSTNVVSYHCWKGNFFLV